MRIYPVLFAVALGIVPGHGFADESSPAVDTARGVLSCPVTMHVQQASRGSAVEVLPGAAGNAPLPDTGPEQLLALSLSNGLARAIQSMDFEVTGISPRARIRPLPTGSVSLRGAAEVVRRVHVEHRLAAAGTLEWTISVPDVTAVTEIALTAVTFEDGEQRSLAKGSQCGTVPDMFMPVANSVY